MPSSLSNPSVFIDTRKEAISKLISSTQRGYLISKHVDSGNKQLLHTWIFPFLLAKVMIKKDGLTLSAINGNGSTSTNNNSHIEKILSLLDEARQLSILAEQSKRDSDGKVPLESFYRLHATRLKLLLSVKPGKIIGKLICMVVRHLIKFWYI